VDDGGEEATRVLFVGDDWAEDHHDVEIVDSDGKRLGRARLPEGMAGITRLHALISEHLDEDAGDPETGMLAPGRVVVGIETDRGPWVAALIAAGYRVFAINPMSVARYRERHTTSGAKSDPGDAHVLAEIVRLDREHHRPIAGDSGEVEGLKLVARTHQSLIWDRTRHLQRLRQVLREYYPGLLDALAAAKLELGDPDAWELIERAPDPDQAARLSRSKIAAILTRNRRRNAAARAEQIQAVLRAPALRQPPAVQAAYATIAVTQLQLLTALAGQIPALEEVLAQDFGRHPDAEVYTSQPGLGVVLGAGCSPSSETTHTATTTRKPARTTPAPPRSPGPPAARPSYWPATPATAASATPSTMGLLRTHQLTRCPRLLRLPTRARDRSPRRAAPAREPPGRHPARLPQNPHPLQRDHRLGTSPSSRSLTSKTMGCLTG
jgi:hypothetical protein